MDEFDSLTDGVFFVPSSTTGKAAGKSQSKASKAAASWDHFKLDGFQQLKDVNEPIEAMEIRHTLFNQEWELMSGRIENVMRSMNTVVLSAIYDFVHNAYSRQSSTAVMPFQELPTGLIFAGINVPDHDILFQQIAQTISSSIPPSTGDLGAESMELENSNKKASFGSESHVVILQSKDCANLKSAQKSMIEQFLGLGIAGAINPIEGGARLQNYDMLVLERWYQSLCEPSDGKGENRMQPTLVIILQDFESFDYDTLQDFITICSNYQERIPFVLLMGLATSIDALHQGLPKAVLSRLQTRKFQMQQSSECLTAIIEDLFIHATVGLMVGPLPLKQLIDQFIHYNFSVGGFISNLKYIVMHHFYANPLSILCDRSLTAQSKALDLLTKGHFDHLRMLPSFQQYVGDKLEVDPQEAEMLILDDEFLVQQIPDMVQGLLEYHQNFGMIFDFLWFLQSRFSISLLKKPKRALYFMALEGTLINSSHIPFLQSLVRKLDSNSMMVFVEDWLQLFKESPRCVPKKSTTLENAMDRELLVVQSIRDRMAALLDNVSEDSVTSSSEIEDNDEEAEASKTSSGGFVKKRKLVSLNVYAHETDSRQTRIAMKTRETARIPKGALGAYTLLVKEIDETISRLFRVYLVCHTSMPLNEICYYSQITIQQKAFLPQPRGSIQTALGQPEVYLNCDCCRPPSGSAGQSLADLVLPTQHDTCILYKLYVECGRMINMYDWFTAFGMILERGQKSDGVEEPPSKKRAGGRVGRAGSKAKTKANANANKLDQKEVQARFISGVAELQFMGFIKSTSRKTDHVMRLTWGNI
ncbi:Origin recognition complex subunit 3 [Linnemannia gamsii]|uniref:Origin recognition complex subunit 3 n=1 Tax=Linnemannia gamsii TaxID=64522 RepID=A0ABQ7JNJ0_9FUNG|nr:Origin recognition complex subunit 3 [Linnemannia gamsii]